MEYEVAPHSGIPLCCVILGVLHLVCGKFLEDNSRDALEATATEDVIDLPDGKFGSDSRITEDNGYPDACERNDEKVKERKKNKKKKRKHTLDYDKNHSIADMNGDSNNFENRRLTSGNV
ncbi:hypothetical protein Tco_1137600 [Tanacetum coccineum]